VFDHDVESVVSELIENERVVCVGECGLDATPRVLANGESSTIVRETQRQRLATQIETALRLGLPLNVHSRAAGHHTIDFIVERLDALTSSGDCDGGVAPAVMMHAFDGRAKYAVDAVEQHGFYFSIAPSIVRDAQMQKLVKRLPLTSLVLESDAPSLGPLKNVRNEPANVAIAARAIAKIKNLDIDVVVRQTNINAKKIFPKLLSSSIVDSKQ
jgi:TatD DNase family protein